VMQQAGLNTLHGHWDDLGEPWLDLCDEMGMLVLGGMYCDGRPQIQSKAGPGWDEFMLGSCRRWTRTVRNHPSIVVWRPADSVMPPGAQSPQMTARYMDVVRQEDGTRPFATDNEHSEIASHAQSPLKNPREPQGEYDDGSVVAQKLAASSRPLLTKEIYAGFRDNVDKLTLFFRQFYEKSWAGRGTGVIVQHIPLIDRATPFKIQWLSDRAGQSRQRRYARGHPAELVRSIPAGLDAIGLCQTVRRTLAEVHEARTGGRNKCERERGAGNRPEAGRTGHPFTQGCRAGRAAGSPRGRRRYGLDRSAASR
jgi:Glycosyl hydrolases family 2, TIM barrel domain